jgi:hypothetical protein
VSKKKIIEGKCAVCQFEGKLSFEHVPPKSAFNDKPILVQGHEHLLDNESHLYKKSSRSNKGFGAYTLCEPCNNQTGGWYANDFAVFAIQAMTQLKAHKGQYGEHQLSFKIKPLNVIKQIVMMFFTANRDMLFKDEDLVNFVKNKKQKGIPNNYQIYLYYTLSKNKRMNGMSVQRTSAGKIVHWSEINFQPFGYLLTKDSPPPNHYMADITKFTKFNYDTEIELKINAGYLSVSSVFTGVYDNA